MAALAANTHEIDNDDFFEVTHYLKKLKPSQTTTLGSLLGLDLDSINYMTTLPDDMVRAWLRKEHKVTDTCGHTLTWEVLVDKLRIMGQNGVANEIAKDKCQQRATKTNTTLQSSDVGTQGLILKPPDLSASVLEHYAYYLRSYFTRNREPADKWPEIEAKEYIRLAVVNNDSHRTDLEEFRKATIHGSIDDILESKAPFEFSDLLRPNTIDDKEYVYVYPIRCLLLEGAPGIGKSTMSWEVCCKWGNGELFQEYSLVVMLRFRDSWVQKVKRLSDMFRYPGEPEMQQEVARQIRQTQGKGVLFILEGFDEAPASLRDKDSLFFELFKGSLLPNATVMVTTRPSASYNLRRYCKGKSSRRIEVLGFGKKEINEYIEVHFSQLESTLKLPVEDFHKYLELYPHIYSMMYVPLNSAIVTHMYQDCKSTSTLVPQTMTQLYTALVKTLLLRYLKDREEYKDLEINHFSDLPQPVLAMFCQVCQLAYHGITKRVKEIIFSGLPKDFDSLGLMQSVSELYIDKGASVSHNFLHLTIQEFLAAYHLSTLSEDEQVAFLEKNFKRQTQMTKFLAGLCEQNPKPVCTVLEKNKRCTPDGQWNIELFELHLLFELHNPQELQATVFKSQNPFIGFTEWYINIISDDEECVPYIPVEEPEKDWFEEEEEEQYNHDSDNEPFSQFNLFDFYVLGYIILVSNCKWTIGIDTRKDDSFTLENLLESFSMHQLQEDRPGRFGPAAHVTELVYETIDACHFTKFPSFPNLEHLHIRYLSEFDSRTRNILACLDDLHITLTVYELSGWGKKEEFMLLCDLLESSHYRIKSFDVSIHDPLAKADYFQSYFSRSRKSSIPHWPRLDIKYTVSSSLIIMLAKCLEVNTTLTRLNFNHCNLGIHGIACLVRSIQHNTTLKSLSFSEWDSRYEYRKGLNLWPHEHANELQFMLIKNKTLVVLSLIPCDLDSQDVVRLAEGLKENSTVKELYLNNNKAGNEGASAIGKALTHNSTLVLLSLDNNSICNEGTTALVDGLKRNSSLHTLSLDGNSIGNEGATVLAEGLKRNESLMCLYIKYNLIGNKGFTALLEALNHNSTLKHLDLRDNPVGGKDELEAMTSILTLTLIKRDWVWPWLKTKNGASVVVDDVSHTKVNEIFEQFHSD